MMKILVPILLLLFLAACGMDTPAPRIGIPRSVPRSAPLPYPQPVAPIETGPVPHAVVFHSGSAGTYGRLEPSGGAYIGAWLLPETTVRGFEELAGRHAVIAHEMHLCDPVPATWILHMIAAQSTPLIIVHPPRIVPGEPPFDAILSLARQLGAFNLRMFIAMYPAPGNTDANNLTPAEYSALMRFTRAAFHMHAPLAAMVWVAPSAAATPSNPFFPGAHNIDWVAAPVMATRNGTDGLSCAMAQIQDFYFAFRDIAPIMLLPLGISHFARGEYIYHIQETAHEIERIYAELAGFPRIGLVVYADAFIISPDTTDGFSISTDPALLEAYRTATAHAHLLPTISRTPATTARTARRSPHAAIVDEGRAYVPVSLIVECLGMPAPAVTRIEDGVEYAALSLPYTICAHSRVIFLDAPTG
jgi:hypothetical protein